MAKKAKILAVDDEALNLDILIRTLEREGFEVIAADDGDTALQKLAAHPDIDLILLDRMMPRMDGMEVMAELKKAPALKDIPVIMQTAASSSTQAFEGAQAGVYYYLTKPYEEFVLISVIREALENAGHGKRAETADGRAAGHDFRLSPREVEVLAWAAKGKSRKDTAVILGISEETVKAHIEKARQKLNADNITHAIAKAFTYGLIAS